MQFEDQVGIMVILQVVTDNFEGKCLRLSILEGHMKDGKLQSTKDKFLKQLVNWMKKYLSRAIEESLIKSVI